jgi:hypothetical protein
MDMVGTPQAFARREGTGLAAADGAPGGVAAPFGGVA